MANIELVIKIPEERFRDIQRIAEVQLESNYFKTVEQIIANGTPLPKGHGRLIDISEYEDKYFNVAITFDDGNHIHEKYTKTIPTIIEADKESEDK